MDWFYGIQTSCCISPGNDNPITTAGSLISWFTGQCNFECNKLRSCVLPSTHTHSHALGILTDIPAWRNSSDHRATRSSRRCVSCSAWLLAPWGHKNGDTHTKIEKILLQSTDIYICVYTYLFGLEKQQHGAGDERRGDPDDSSDGQIASLAHPRLQRSHNGHISVKGKRRL